MEVELPICEPLAQRILEGHFDGSLLVQPQTLRGNRDDDVGSLEVKNPRDGMYYTELITTKLKSKLSGLQLSAQQVPLLNFYNYYDRPSLTPFTFSEKTVCFLVY